MKIKIGAIIEIPTSKGLAYAQYTHKHPEWGCLIRVLEGVFPERPVDLEKVAQHHTFMTFFPLGAAIRRKIFTIIGHAYIPEYAQAFPVFKNKNYDAITQKTLFWHLWNGHKTWRVLKLTGEQQQYPLQRLMNDTLLIELIEQGNTDMGKPEHYVYCLNCKDAQLIHHQHTLPLNEQAQLIIEWLSCCTEGIYFAVYFEQKGIRVNSAGEDTNPLVTLKKLLANAVENKLQLPSSLKSTPGVMWNDWEDNADYDWSLFPDASERTSFDPSNYLWLTSRYFSGFNTWIYNNKNNEIVFEITPTLKQQYEENGIVYESYDYWKKNIYKPYTQCIITKEQARELIEQIKKIL